MNQLPSPFPEAPPTPTHYPEAPSNPQEHYKQLEKNILSQLNYCRFLGNLSEGLKGAKLGQGYLLLCEIESKYSAKMAEIGQAFKTEESVFGSSELMTVYTATKRGEKLKKIYHKYDALLNEQRETDFSFEADSTLSSVIR